jgi:TonB-linked SusC/RagA family outer membrane protein
MLFTRSKEKNAPKNWKLSSLLFLLIISASGYNLSIFANAKVSSSFQDPEETMQTAPFDLTGRVIDDNGEPVVGANIIIKGQTTGTSTDSEGNFVLRVKEGDVLVVSFIGMQPKEVAVTGQQNVQIILSSDKQFLEEVVVIGFGTQKKVDLTGSVGVADAKVLESRPVMTATQALQGLIPGLQISQNMGGLEARPSINIRGTTTIGEGSSGSPLILIDGMEGDINALNPQDIESISVLKDASASSIYGSRAPFGVILVTTKKGHEGKPTFNYNNSFRWNNPVLLPDIVDSYTFAIYFNDASTNGGYSPQFGEDQLQRIKDFQDGKLKTTVPVNPNNPSMWGDGYLYGNDNVDWYDALYRSWVFSQEHNFSVNGGGTNVTYYLSANYLDQNGLMKLNQDTYDKYTVTAKIGIKLSEWASLNYSSRFIREKLKRPSFLRSDFYYNLARQGWPTLPLYDPNGYLYSSPSPALNLRDGGCGRYVTDHLYQQAQIVLEPIKGWKTFGEINYRIFSKNTHWEIQKTYNHNVAGDPYPYNNNSHVHEGHEKENYLNVNIYSEYSKSFDKRHDLKVMVGFQSELLKYKTFGAQREGIIVPSLPEIDLTSGLDAYGDDVTPYVFGSRDHWATAGFFGRLNYDYLEKYLLEVNLRYDGTSRFRKDNRWKWFPSFSLGWNIAKENFWSNLRQYVNTLKIRGSYGELGNQNTDNWYPTYQVMTVSAASGDWLIDGKKPNTSSAPSLVSSTMTWEKIKTWNLGLDVAALENRLNASFDIYTRRTLDMIGPAPELPLVLGTSVPKTNNTNLKTYGMELSIEWNDRLQFGLGYSVKFLLSDSQTKITKYPNETGNLSSYRKGMKMGEIWGYETVGIAKSQEEMDSYLASLPNGGQDALGTLWSAGDIMYKDLNQDGKIDNGSNTEADHGDLRIIGNSTPRYQFGLDINLDYKGFDFRLFFQGVMKRDYFNGSYYFWGATSTWDSTCMEPHLDYFRDDPDHYLGQNLDSYFPRPDFSSSKNHYTQTRYLQNAAYIRLKNLQLGYTIPEKLTQKIRVSKLRVFLSGENLWTGTSMFETFDPETIDGGWSGSVYPLCKTLSFGASITF